MTTTEAAAPATAPRQRGERRLLTPEGVPLIFQLAERGGRAAAVLIDIALMFVAIAVFALAIVFGALALGIDGAGAALFGGLVILISFFIRSFYFIYFELRWQGQTPGKRLLGIRVIDRKGGYLTPDAVFARNLLREVELFLPITLLTAPSQGSGAWVNLLTLLWVGIFLFLPFFNKDRLRAGDLVAGTWVIAAPKAMLLGDVAAEATPPKRGGVAADPEFPFTRSQLEIYGIYELQTLEEVLRHKGPQSEETQREVARRIQQKIAWTGEAEVDTERFLKAFYAALRGHLEARMLFGERRENKYAGKEGGTPPPGGTAKK
ncbi:RDD family protein [Pelagibius sp. 7325]|uniref:RDD family protein n=1 Tax=Pelagibius sp. 7325 TaxID=3131994 RepID=UPI0030EBFBA9